MLQTEYINSFNHNYLKIKSKKQENVKIRYQYQIITTRKLEGLLPVSMHSADGEQGLYYEISSMQSLSKWFIREKIDRKWMENLVACLQVVLWSLEEYLLDSRNLILRPDCIFQDMESGKLYFLYYPYYIEEEKTDMEDFLSFLVENVEETEPETVEALYDMFSKWENLQEQFTLKTLLLLWEKHEKEGNTQKMCEEEKEAVHIPVQEEREETERGINRKKDITDFFFGRYMRSKAEAPKACLAMESWEYKAEREPEEQGEERTAYVEVSPGVEERKLYGNGKQNRKVICLKKLPLVIGKKGEMTDVVLQDASVSRMHARLTEENGQIYLEDLNTTNGTYKNGVRLKPYEKVEILREDEIRLGNLSFTYR
ncbi:MAG: DUF6382 domain-containing protein [Lachnospiraceae bacterium]